MGSVWKDTWTGKIITILRENIDCYFLEIRDKGKVKFIRETDKRFFREIVSGNRLIPYKPNILLDKMIEGVL